MGKNYIEEFMKDNTLLEKLKVQGFGWQIFPNGSVEKIDIEGMEQNSYNCGNVFLTKTEAEREVYRRKLDFEMQEWARENECLGVYQGSHLLNAFTVSFKNEHRENDCINKFYKQLMKYYHWEVQDENK